MGGERRLVTIVFADVVGSTSLGERLEPEDVHALLSRLFAFAASAVERHGGTLEKFIGDAVFAVFGMPQAHGDDPERALDTALELRDRAQGDHELATHLPIRIGVNTGLVLANPDRERGDFLVVGDAVNVAARLQQSANPWEILCSERTARAAGHGFAFGPAVTVAVAGRVSEVTARPVVGRAASPAQGLDVPLVGRGPDLAQLDLLLGRTVIERRPFLVTVVALPGMGKTRLLVEFARLAADRSHRVLTTGSPPYGERLTYWSLRKLLLDLLALDTDADRADIVSALSLWCSDWDPSGRVDQDVVAASIGITEHEVEDQHAVHLAWMDLLRAATTQGPVVLIAEDLHWASSSFLDLVAHLSEPRDDVPVLTITSTRPELFDRRPEWGGRRRNYLALSLEPLGQAEVAELVRHLTSPHEAAVALSAVHRAEGNPFFVGEIVRSLRHPESVSIELPDTVQSAVLGRLDLLKPEERRLLQLASIYGLEFPMEGVAALAERANISAQLDRLVADEYLVTGRHGHYEFRHILVRDVAYGTLARGERAALHQHAGDWLARMVQGREQEMAELVAEHYRQSALLRRGAADGTGGAVLEDAVRWLLRAASVATAAGSQLAAAEHLTHAIELASTDQLPELYAALGDAYGAQPRAAAQYEAAVRLGSEQSRDVNFLLRNLSLALQVYARFAAPVPYQPVPDELAAKIRRAEDLYARADDERARASYLVARAFEPFRARTEGREPPGGEVRSAERMAAEGIALAEKVGDTRLASAGLDALCLLVQPEQPDRAMELLQRRLALRGLGMVERSDAYYTLAWNRACVGDLPGCLDAAEEGLSIAEPALGAGFAIGLAAWRAWALMLLGRWSDVPGAERRLRQLWENDGRPAAVYTIQGFLAAWEVARARGDGTSVERLTGFVTEMIEAFDPGHPVRGIAHLISGDVDRVREAVGTPERYWQRMYFLERMLAFLNDDAHRLPSELMGSLLREAVRRGVPILEAESRRAMGLAHDDADQLGRAIDIFRRIEIPASLGRVQIELGTRLGDEPLVQLGRRTLAIVGDKLYVAKA